MNKHNRDIVCVNHQQNLSTTDNGCGKVLLYLQIITFYMLISPDYTYYTKNSANLCAKLTALCQTISRFICNISQRWYYNFGYSVNRFFKPDKL